ncbi:hypothetical protein BAUCODRAFT_422724 [Baudoinia panamericana UAMH 10762]|uniref:PEBP-like protein n=1 Tax=Baudoinia panamericana (strain UAMH 10762) TaxID=717646 RepID=M2NH54_BAUPA|nr:uncharacterized protein BAUCODRAFT_422724 [Baudoinia panamericana UAMH 10762]EMC98355.1 hypothetical protein BAUCODRAFT_422724 [Baudoinia panamericana UAMH 10762]
MNRFASAAITLAALASCQTPPNYHPAAAQSLSVSYINGASVQPGDVLDQSLVSTKPAVSLDFPLISPPYVLLLLDIEATPTASPSAAGAHGPPLGLEPGQTTWLQWLQTNVTQGQDGSLVSSSPALSSYAGPQPPNDGLAHTYVMYLFPEPPSWITSGVKLSGPNAGRNLAPFDSPDRFNFDLTALAETAGLPVAANYFRVVNPAAVPNPAVSKRSLSGRQGAVKAAANATATTAPSSSTNATATLSGVPMLPTQTTNAAGSLEPVVYGTLSLFLASLAFVL